MPAFVRPKHQDESSPFKRSSDATTATMASEDSSETKQSSLARRSLADRARVFDKSYTASPKKIAKADHLQTLLDHSDHRKQSMVINGRRPTYRDKTAREMGMIVDASTKEANELRALLDASQHRKRAHVSDGVKPVYRPSHGKKTSKGFSIIPKGSLQVKQMQMGPNMQKLLDASQHKKLLQTSSEHRLAHRMMQGSQHSRAPAFTFNLRTVKNRTKPALPVGMAPLPPTETTFQNVHAPKLTVDIKTFEAPSYPKTQVQQDLIREAMQKNTFVLKRQTGAAAQTLVDAMEPIEMRKGQIIQRQGETRQEDDQLYVVEEGHVHVKVNGKVVDTIRAGQTFGQERLLLRKTNEATYQAGTAVTKLFRLDQMTFRAVLQKQYQSVLEELKAKTPRTEATTTWHEDIYSHKSDEQSEYEEITIGEEYEEYDEMTSDDEDDLVSFQADESVDDSFFEERITIASKASSSKVATREIIPGKKKKQLKRSKLFHFEESPVFQKQEALRKSACKYASSKDDLEFIKVLGEGQFGEVWLVAATLPDHDPSRQEFALKMQKLSEDDEDDCEGFSGGEAKDAVRNEIKALQVLHHPFIVNLVHTYESEDSLDMLLGLIPGGELWDEIHKQEPDGNWVSGISEGRARFYAYVLADTLGFIHSRGYIFRDLKPENIMIDQDGYPVIVDFGFAKYLEPDEKTFTFCGTPNYVAPEIITNAGHGKEVDYWALGVVIYEMVSGENPFFFDGMEQFALYEAITEEDPYEMSADVTASDQVRELTDLLFIKDPNERLGSQGAHEILDHSWFRGMPDLSEIHAKSVDPQVVSELIFDETGSIESTNDEDSFADLEIEPLNDIPEEKSQQIEVEFPEEFGKVIRSNSFVAATPKDDIHGKVPRRKSADDALLYDEEEVDEIDDTATSLISPVKAYNPDSPQTIKYWTPRKKGLGYYVNMKSPEERLSSQSRRSVVGNFLSQYLENIDLNDEEDDYLTKVMEGEGKRSSKLNSSCPAFR